MIDLKVQTLILWGSKDKTAPIDWAYQLQSLISNSTLFVLEGFKHMAIIERPLFFIDSINEFLGKKATNG